MSRIDAYFSHLTSKIGKSSNIHVVAVAHMVPNTLHFAPAIDKVAELSSILAKPKTKERQEYLELEKKFNLHVISRDWANDPADFVEYLHGLELKNKDLVIVDIGGYFSESIDAIASTFEGNILGVMEGTENGVQKYERNLPFKTPIVTVARSPLKLPEDYLVASSLVFSVEAVLREQAEILQTREAAVIGYGRVGSAVAEILRGRGLSPSIFDVDPMKLAEAAARGFSCFRKLSDALCAKSLVVCATGNKSLELKGFGALKSGAVVASVTSADDEFDLSSLDAYTRTSVSDNLVRYTEDREGGRYFELVAGGNAANFIHGAVIGPAIQLIEGEKLFAIKSLIDGKFSASKSKIHELSQKTRAEVADIWNEHFL